MFVLLIVSWVAHCLSWADKSQPENGNGGLCKKLKGVNIERDMGEK